MPLFLPSLRPRTGPTLVQPFTRWHQRSYILSSTKKLLQAHTSNKPIHYAEQKLLMFSPQQLFDLVTNVNEYARFIPYCVSSRVLSVHRLPALPPNLPSLVSKTPMSIRRHYLACAPLHSDRHQVLASLDVGFSGLHLSYTSKITCLSPHLVIVEASNSPLFSSLLTVWSFKNGHVPNSTNVDFFLSFSFRSGLHAQLAQVFFNQINRQTMSAFEARARFLYGPNGKGPFAPLALPHPLTLSAQ